MHARSTTHTVKSGDTVNSLAKANKVSWKKIAKLNNLKAPYSLKPGSKLKIPPRKK
jgi:LysM repeat protein